VSKERSRHPAESATKNAGETTEHTERGVDVFGFTVGKFMIGVLHQRAILRETAENPAPGDMRGGAHRRRATPGDNQRPGADDFRQNKIAEYGEKSLVRTGGFTPVTQNGTLRRIGKPRIGLKRGG